MWKKAKRFLAVLLALTLMLSVVDSEELFVSASATNVQEDTGAGGETETAAGEETESTDVAEESEEAVTQEVTEEPEESLQGEKTSEEKEPVPETGTEMDMDIETENSGDQTADVKEEDAEDDQTVTESEESGAVQEEAGKEMAEDGEEPEDGVPAQAEDAAIAEEGAKEDASETETETGSVTVNAAETETDNSVKPESVVLVGELTDGESEEEPAVSEAAVYSASVDQGDQTVKVIVDVPEGAFEEDISPKLHANAITEEDEFNRTAAEVEEQTDSTFDGMIALDVYFTDGDSNEEIEPAVPVSVRFELPESVLPEDIDASTLTVHHLAETTDENGEMTVNVETVATAVTDDGVDGVVALSSEAAEKTDAAEDVALLGESDSVAESVEESMEDPAVVAEFEVESFSAFTITWTESGIIDRDESISFTIVDTDGNVLNVPDGYKLEYQLTYNEQMPFEKIVTDNEIQTISINGEEYVFRNATLIINNGERHPVSSVEWIETGSLVKNDQVRFYDSVFPGETGYYTRDDGGDSEDSLELVYQRAEDSSTEVYEPDPTYSKTAVTKDGGKTYDLALTVSGAVGTTEEKQKIDILFIVDQSGSMTNQMFYEKENDDRNYQYVVADQAQALATALAGNANLDTRFSVVTFSSDIAETNYYKDGIMRLSWTNDASRVFNAADQPSNGGTNYEAGLMSGRAAILESRPDALKYVIFLSDGEPTYHYTENGSTTGGADETLPDDIGNAVEEAQNNYKFVNGFFTIRVGNESGADGHLTSIREAVKTAAGVSGDNDNFQGFAADESGTLVESFEKIQAQITSLTMTNVLIEDVLTQYVEAEDGAEPYLSVKHMENGQVITERYSAGYKGNVIKEIAYDSSSKILKCEFVDTYSLLPGYTYELHLSIKPTGTAFSEYAATGYPSEMIGEADTGTYAGKNGFYSNEKGNAKLTYATTLRDHSLEYPMPVVQVPSTGLIITKNFNGLDSNKIGDAANLITFTVKDGSTVVADDVKLALKNGAYTAEVTGLTVGKTYTVTENCTAPEGYEVTPEEATQTTGPLERSPEENTLTFTNEYTPSKAEVKICKQIVIEGDENADLKAFSGKVFPFRIDGSDSTNAEVSQNVSITVGDKGTGQTIIELPLGNYTITELTTSAEFPDDVGDYEFILNNGSQTINVTAAGGEAAIKNVYKHQDKVLTVTKTVPATEGSMGDTSKAFIFSLKVTDGSDRALTDDIYRSIAATAKRYNDEAPDTLTLTFNDSGTAEFTLSSGQRFEITIPHGYMYQVSETPDGYTPEITVTGDGTVSGANVSGTLTQDTTLAYANTLTVQPPTGLNNNSTPYTLMLTVSALAGLVLIGSIFAYRRRHRM